MTPLFSCETYEFETSLPHDEVVRRLKARVVSMFAVFSSRAEFPVAGNVRNEACELFARPSMFVHNSFIRVLALRIDTTATGTRLRGSFRLMRFVQVFMSIWFAGIFLMSIGWLRQGIRASGWAFFGAADAYFPLLLMLGGVLIVAAGRLMGMRAEKKVLAFLEEVLALGPGGEGMGTVKGRRHHAPTAFTAKVNNAPRREFV